MAAEKRKRPSSDAAAKVNGEMPPPPLKRRASSRRASHVAVETVNPDINSDVVDAPNALRASPDSAPNGDLVSGSIKTEGTREESPLSDAPDVVEPPPKKARMKKIKHEQQVKDAESVVAAVVDAAETHKPPPKKGGGKKKAVKQEDPEAEPTAASKATPAKKAKKTGEEDRGDPEADGDGEPADEEEIKEALARPPPVNSDYLPLPWKGRLGYACLNTYLRMSNPPVFSSRTTRIQSILEHRHPLADPSQPEHPTKNRPDKSKPAETALGQRFVEQLGLANTKDIAKMVRWNDRYGIKFFRLSSEIFPFASHPEYGYKLAPFATDALAEAGKVIAELGHRVTTHPGQFTQLGSPRPSVIDNALRDLDYHDEMLSLLKLPEQQNRDAVMILHMGGVFDGKEDTLNRFRENYAKLSQSVKNRIVLENDDVCYTVHDLLPICEELNIPFVLDYHHHNILFDAEKIREGTKDIVDLYPRILETWRRKSITPKMHYSEPTPAAITPRQRRKHNPRVASLPPCPPDMDLMIEAKDKEQAVFELMKTFKLPGFDTFNEILPYERRDDNKFAESVAGQRKQAKGEVLDLVPEEEVGMGGPEGRVYWPPGMEEYLRPKKRDVKKKSDEEVEAAKKEKTKKDAEKAYAEREAAKKAAKGEAEVKEEDSDSDVAATPATKKAKAAMKKRAEADALKVELKAAEKAAKEDAKAAVKAEAVENGSAKKKAPAKKPKVKKEAKAVPTPSPSNETPEPELQMSEDEDDKPLTPINKRPNAGGRKTTGRAAKGRVSYKESEDDEILEAV